MAGNAAISELPSDRKREAGAAPSASFFSLRTQLLDEGRTDRLVARTNDLEARIKVYASGGENGLHTHPNEDHVFVIMQGTARFYDAEGGHNDVGTHQGVMLPAGAFYWFEATSTEPLVLMRIGARLGGRDTFARLNSRGEPMPGKSAENKTSATVFRDGAFFE